jgi:osmotically-inducible protein OsmY
MKQDMKLKLKLITGVSVASLLALAALGQETTNQPIAQTGATPQSGITTRDDQLNGAAKASEIIGMTVNTNATTGADNTQRNVRDRDSRTLTPLDQGNSQVDVNTTAQIRKEILATKGMTTNGKNVKIITLNGHVTLRGPVNTAEEKTRIGEIANRIAQSSNVDNQLEVSQTTTNSPN